MAVLKTDYKDAVFEGARKYKETVNPDGTKSYEDQTSYTQEGDAFGAKELNGITGAINRINHVTEVTLTAAGWIGSTAPYTQTVSVSGATADMELLLVSALQDSASATEQKAYAKAFGIVSCGTATVGNGNVTFKVYKKPASNCKVGLKGV